MILIVRTKTLIAAGILLCTAIVIAGIYSENFKSVSVNESNYRVFVAGLGTVEGRWCGETGIAVIGLETRPAPVQSEELKVIDLLVANGGSVPVQFDADVTLTDPQGKRYSLRAKDQPKVQINPGALSQGTIIINVPKGTPDKDWMVEIKGGHLKDGVVLPLRVVKIKE